MLGTLDLSTAKFFKKVALILILEKLIVSLTLFICRD